MVPLSTLRFVFAAVLVAGCGASERATPSSAGDAVEADPTSAERVPARLRLEAMRDDMLCKGPCPGVLSENGDLGSLEVLTLSRAGRGCTVEVHADGTVIFRGYSGGKPQGRVVEHIDATSARALVRRFDDAGARFNAYGVSAPSVMNWTTDLPVSSLVLRRGTRELTIFELAGAPFDLADEVERATKAERCASWWSSTAH